MATPGIPELRLLIGPTASGKSAVALEFARRRKAALLSVDSMKIYRQLQIGVAKPTAEECSEVPHHLINVRDAWESFSVAEWLAEAERLARENTNLIAEGGTALYIQSLLYGLFKGPGQNLEIRARLEQEAQTNGLETLYRRLLEKDPDAAKKILPGDLRRIVRALEVLELTGEPISKQQVQWTQARADLKLCIVGLRLDRAELYRRIDARIGRMLDAGWLDECRALLALPQPLSREATQALGYRTLFAHVRGEITLDAARERICFDTHHFARRQLMWFRRFPGVTWIEVGTASTSALADQVEAAWDAPTHG